MCYVTLTPYVSVYMNDEAEKSEPHIIYSLFIEYFRICRPASSGCGYLRTLRRVLYSMLENIYNVQPEVNGPGGQVDELDGYVIGAYTQHGGLTRAI